MRIIFIFIIIISNIYALEIYSKYKVTFGLFGQIGEAVATLESNSTNYSITMRANSTAFARAVSDNRQELYKSEGVVVNGAYRPKLFTKIVTTNHSSDDSRFVFDYKNQKVTMHRERYKLIKDFLTQSYTKEIDTSVDELEYFADNDLLTLFFNLPIWSKDIDSDEIVQYAVGANRKDGKVNIKTLSPKKENELKKVLGSGQKYLSVIINQKIFASEKGELFVVLDEDNLGKKAILKDVIFFGDIIGEMVEKRVIKNQ